MSFVKAKRTQVKLKIAVTGPSGSGKTYSSLLIAKGLGSKIAVIDTENGSASLYADRFEFDTNTITEPYTIAKYTTAIDEAVKAGYDVVVVDSLSHAWAGEGGLLAKKESMDARGGNSYTNWAGITKEHEAFKSKILNTPIHIVATMRSKQDYVLETNEKGKQAPKKVGLAPIQRDGMEYEFTTVFDVAMNHEASVSKDRSGLFDGQIFKITEDTGKQFIKWLSTANKENKAASVPPPGPAKKSEPVEPSGEYPDAPFFDDEEPLPGPPSGHTKFSAGQHSGKTFQEVYVNDTKNGLTYTTNLMKLVAEAKGNVPPIVKDYLAYAEAIAGH